MGHWILFIALVGNASSGVDHARFFDAASCHQARDAIVKEFQARGAPGYLRDAGLIVKAVCVRDGH